MGETIQQAMETLEDAGVQTARLDAEVLLAHHLSVARGQLHARWNEHLPIKQKNQYQRIIAQRAAREPVAYITGRKEFYGLDFYVDHRVLIPRPETEILVDHAIQMAQDNGWSRLADVGTGCGAIAVALAVHLSTTTVYAVDNSREALEVAHHNCRRHDVENRVKLLRGNLLDPLTVQMDLIVANLPYVRTSELCGLPPEIREYEPVEALDGGEDGLQVISDLLHEAQPAVRSGGAIVLEIGADQGAAVMGLTRENLPGASTDLIQDYANQDRVVVVRYRDDQKETGRN